MPIQTVSNGNFLIKNDVFVWVCVCVYIYFFLRWNDKIYFPLWWQSHLLLISFWIINNILQIGFPVYLLPTLSVGLTSATILMRKNEVFLLWLSVRGLNMRLKDKNKFTLWFGPESMRNWFSLPQNIRNALLAQTNCLSRLSI